MRCTTSHKLREHGTKNKRSKCCCIDFLVALIAPISVLIPFPEGLKEPELNTSGQDLYFEVLELQPIRLAISFMRTERLNTEDRYVMLEAIDAVLTVP